MLVQKGGQVWTLPSRPTARRRAGLSMGALYAAETSLLAGSPQRQRRKPKAGISLGNQYQLVSHASEKHPGQACLQKKTSISCLFHISVTSVITLSQTQIRGSRDSQMKQQCEGSNWWWQALLNFTLLTQPRLSSCFAAWWKFNRSFEVCNHLTC